MFNDQREFEPDGFDAFSELDDGDLEEWDSLKDLLSDLDDREREPIAPGSFNIPPLLGDGDGIARWVLCLHQIRRLSTVTSLLGELPHAPWCIAVRTVALDAAGIRLGVTTTRRVTQGQLTEFVMQLLGSSGDLTVDVEPVVRQSVGV